MGKYDALEKYLRRQKAAEVELDVMHMERILGAMLPNAAARQGWWTGLRDDPLPPHIRAWRAAGYTATLLEGGGRVRFQRLALRSG